MLITGPLELIVAKMGLCLMLPWAYSIMIKQHGTSMTCQDLEMSRQDLASSSCAKGIISAKRTELSGPLLSSPFSHPGKNWQSLETTWPLAVHSDESSKLLAEAGEELSKAVPFCEGGGG